jgi:ATP-dependent DNA helicase PIF1
MSPHNLLLEVGSPIMLVRNLDAPRLCNGMKTDCGKSYVACYRSNHSNRLRKGWWRISIANTDDSHWYAIWVQTAAVSCSSRICNVEQQSARTITDGRWHQSCKSHDQRDVTCSKVGPGKNLYVLATEWKTMYVVYEAALRWRFDFLEVPLNKLRTEWRR